MIRLDSDAVQEPQALKPGMEILPPPRIIAGKFRKMRRRSQTLQVQSCGIARSLILLIVDESTALLQLPLQQPVTDFKDQVRKLGVWLNAGPYAERLHQP